MYKVYDNIICAKKKRKLRCCELPALYLLMLNYVVRDQSFVLLIPSMTYGTV